MQILLVIPSFLIFIYTIFKLVKDDHVFFRRNIKLEHFFDYTFIMTFVSWLFIQIFNIENKEQMTVVILAASVTLFSVAKYNKIPLGRFFDFFTLSFLSSVPLWFLLSGLFTKAPESILYFLSSAFYLIIAVFFMRVLFPKVMNRTLREGSLSIFFIVFYSFFSILISSYYIIYNKANILSVGNVLIVLMLLASVPLLIKIQK